MTYTDQQSNREWWAQRWVDLLESFGWIRRLARARTYAREGNVLKLEFNGAKVFALVQGTAPEPYKVSLSLDPFDDEQWQYVIETMAAQAFFSAKLLSGEMPHNIESVFTANGLSLFPLTKFDIHSRCSCPDKANPCKHIGAVYYILGDRFSDDPFVLFQLRGRTREQIIMTLRQLRSQSADTPQDCVEDLTQPQPMPSLPAQGFWHYEAPLDPSLVVITPPGTETILDVLGTLPMKSTLAVTNPAIATQAVMEDLRGIYTDVSQRAVLKAMSANS
jgi:uncharacterized Zn finger protein